MLKINKVVKADNKLKANMLFHGLVSPIGGLHFDREASVNELIAHYAKESALCNRESTGDGIANAFLSVALLLAFIERITSPSIKPSSVKEILDTEDFTIEDMIAECVGITAKSIFEGDDERADEYLVYLVALIKTSLQEEGYDFHADNDESDEPDLSDYESEVNEEPVPEEEASPI